MNEDRVQGSYKPTLTSVFVTWNRTAGNRSCPATALKSTAYHPRPPIVLGAAKVATRPERAPPHSGFPSLYCEVRSHFLDNPAATARSSLFVGSGPATRAPKDLFANSCIDHRGILSLFFYSTLPVMHDAAELTVIRSALRFHPQWGRSTGLCRGCESNRSDPSGPRAHTMLIGSITESRYCAPPASAGKEHLG